MHLFFVVLVGIVVFWYSGILRIGELLSIEVRHIRIVPEDMCIFLPKRKNDQFRAGNTIYIAKRNKITCPVSITDIASNVLLQMLPNNRGSCYPVVRRLQNNEGV